MPQVTWQPDGKGGYTPVMNANNTPANADIVAGIEQINPLFHLLNGDLCYANLDPDRVRTWNSFFANNTRSARYRAWMPAAGNHENEKGNGPLGFSAYQTYIKLPGGGKRPSTYVYEQTPWLALRDAEHPYGFAAFTVDPGTGPGSMTRIYVTYYNVTVPDGEIVPLESFTLQRRRSDRH